MSQFFYLGPIFVSCCPLELRYSLFIYLVAQEVVEARADAVVIAVHSP